MSADTPAVLQVDPALRVKDVAPAIGFSPMGFYRLRRAKRFPEPDLHLPSLKNGADPIPAWYASTVRRWLAQQERPRRSDGE